MLVACHRQSQMGFYGDAGAYSDNNSLYVFTWNSLMGTGPTMAKRFLCTCIKKSDMVEGTEEALFEVLAWSFNVLLTGIWPTTDWLGRTCTDGHPGQYLANGLRGCLTQVRGDWEFYCSVFQFPKMVRGRQHVLPLWCIGKWSSRLWRLQPRCPMEGNPEDSRVLLGCSCCYWFAAAGSPPQCPGIEAGVHHD